MEMISKTQRRPNITLSLPHSHNTHTQLGIIDRPLLECISRASQRQAESFDPQSVANVVWAFARLESLDLPLAVSMATVAAKESAAFSAQVCVWVCVR